MDYKELIRLLRDESNCDVLNYIEDDATAIEALLAERDAAIREQQTTLGGTYVSIERFNAVKAELDALREKQTAKLDRRRFGWCRYCDGGQGVVTFEVPDEIDVPEDVVKFEWIEVPRYCPICGKPQTDEAWAELKNRVEACKVESI